MRRLERPLARVVEGALEAPVLEDQHEDAERRAEVEQVHQQRLDRQDHRAGHQEEDDQRRDDHDREASGRCSTRLAWRSMKSAVAPPTRTASGPARTRRPVAGSLRRRRCGARPPRRVAAVPPAARRLDRRDARDRRDLAERPRGRVGRAAHRELDRRVAERREVARIASSAWRALADSGSTGASTEVNLIARKGMPEHDQQRGAGGRDRPGRRITKRESRYQKPAASSRASRSARRWRKLRRERVHARRRGASDRRQHDERHRRGDQRHERAADPHRVEEALREDGQRGQRARRR